MAESCGTVTVEPAFERSLVSLGDCSIGTGTITEGDTIVTTASVSNDNEYTAIVDVELSIDGSSEAEETVDVASNSSVDVEYEVDFSEPGDYDLSVDITKVSQGGGR